ncbi:hypothetical protein SAMN05421595_2172 [Austwickia chelonae]|uniref:Uncharacterized protein n=1 Tax=Austwickia chelonae NBRC 105200 TaxID=1184607 RepID=K6VNV7_9MICO|nr:hypothetical protein [Austwickia chelonae]GAB77035.1 hypothetical protein AUCHE_04_00760 [Austwickia chelonae NBRC 105200]SEW33449.1 hypothetical protein SAMN05421595_2172 [Austwickia chelonae]
MSDPTRRHDYFDSDADGVADTPDPEQAQDEYRYAPIVLIGAAVMLVLAIGTSTWTLHNATRGTSSSAVAAKAGHTSSASPAGAGQTSKPGGNTDGRSPGAKPEEKSATAPAGEPKPAEKGQDDKAADKDVEKPGEDKAGQETAKGAEPGADRTPAGVAAPSTPKPTSKETGAPAETPAPGEEGTLSVLSKLSTSDAAGVPAQGRPMAYLQIRWVGAQDNFVTPPSGSKTWTAADILAAHKAHQATFPSAKLMSWTEKGGRQVWSTVVTNPEWKTRQDAVKWCQDTYSSYGPYEKSTALRSRCYVP